MPDNGRKKKANSLAETDDLDQWWEPDVDLLSDLTHSFVPVCSLQTSSAPQPPAAKKDSSEYSYHYQPQERQLPVIKPGETLSYMVNQKQQQSAVRTYQSNIAVNQPVTPQGVAQAWHTVITQLPADQYIIRSNFESATVSLEQETRVVAKMQSKTALSSISDEMKIDVQYKMRELLQNRNVDVIFDVIDDTVAVVIKTSSVVLRELREQSPALDILMSRLNLELYSA